MVTKILRKQEISNFTHIQCKALHFEISYWLENVFIFSRFEDGLYNKIIIFFSFSLYILMQVHSKFWCSELAYFFTRNCLHD